jgi:glycosyltransferase involved in cell wall biosynthesis
VFREVAPRLRALEVGALVYVAVDLHHRRLAGRAEVTADPEVAAEAAAYAEIELANIAAADLTVVNSTDELEVLRGAVPSGTRVVHLPMARPVGACRTSDDTRDHEVVFLGGFLHEPNVDAVTWFLDEVWPSVAAALPDATFVFYGADVPVALAERTDERVRMGGRVPTVEDAFARARLSVVPLRYGAGVKGKLVTALVNGVPVVATPVGVEGLDLTPDEVTVAVGAEAFATAVIDLYVDRERREAQRLRAYDVARQRHSLDALVARLAAALDGLGPG